jgi:16S rRNA (uracil1498-N3)-methyltransferase
MSCDNNFDRRLSQRIGPGDSPLGPTKNNLPSDMPASTAHLRRLHVPSLQVGLISLDSVQAHHARQVLRLPDGGAVELFDDAGNTAAGVLRYPDDRETVVEIESISSPRTSGMIWSIASAVPKAERADWLVEKLSELGVSRWIPLATERSVALPTGAGKRQRWQRIATESVMAIDELTPLAAAIPAGGLAASQSPGCTSEASTSWVLSTGRDAQPIMRRLMEPAPAAVTVFIGPEGGWTESELHQFAGAGIGAVRLGPTILRVETAAVAAAAMISAIWT